MHYDDPWLPYSTPPETRRFDLFGKLVALSIAGLLLAFAVATVLVENN